MNAIATERATSLPIVRQSSFATQPIDWLGLPRRYMNDGEMEVLVALARECCAEVAVEIGCNSGRTSRLMLHNVETLKRLVGIDVLPGYQFAKQCQRKEVPAVPGEYAMPDSRFELIVTRHGSFDLTPDDLPTADFVFIDGDHSARAIRHDTALARKIIRPGGIIAWHDYSTNGRVDVKDVLDAMRATGDDIRLVQDTWIAFQRV